jgi:hypothetical protein
MIRTVEKKDGTDVICPHLGLSPKRFAKEKSGQATLPHDGTSGVRLAMHHGQLRVANVCQASSPPTLTGSSLPQYLWLAKQNLNAGIMAPVQRSTGHALVLLEEAPQSM